jgi:hypothetical protein
MHGSARQLTGRKPSGQLPAGLTGGFKPAPVVLSRFTAGVHTALQPPQ